LTGVNVNSNIINGTLSNNGSTDINPLIDEVVEEDSDNAKPEEDPVTSILMSNKYEIVSIIDSYKTITTDQVNKMINN
jgi:hypothetical protein